MVLEIIWLKSIFDSWAQSVKKLYLIWGLTCIKYLICYKKICGNVLKSSRHFIHGTLKKKFLRTRVDQMVDGIFINSGSISPTLSFYILLFNFLSSPILFVSYFLLIYLCFSCVWTHLSKIWYDASICYHLFKRGFITQLTFGDTSITLSTLNCSHLLLTYPGLTTLCKTRLTSDLPTWVLKLYYLSITTFTI